jgi:tetratricopeptide (TPR) repeat protein
VTIANPNLPKYVGWSAFAVYLLTLAHGVTADNLQWTARVADWDLQPLVGQPVLWLGTLPLRWLPATWTPVLLNIFSAWCGAWVLQLLARSVQILPQNRTPVQRIFLAEPRGLYQGAENWAPAILAAVVCGLEFNFWQQSVAAVGETLDAVLFASSLRWLLEYRAEHNPRFLRRALFLWGLGMAESWVMILLLPFFVLGVAWLRGRRFFQFSFLLRATLTGLAGFSAYLISPLVNSLLPNAPMTFHDAWLLAVRDTKQTFSTLHTVFWLARKDVTGLIAACFILPLLPALIRSRADGAYRKSLPEKIQILFYHLTHLLLLFACLWMAFDPLLGPRRLAEQQTTAAMPLLLFDYLVALSAGYLAGYFVVIYSGDYRRLFRRKTKNHRPPFTPRWLRRLAPIIWQSLPVIVAVPLFVRNLPPIIAINRLPLKDFGELAAGSLPEKGAGIVLCDDLMRAIVLRSAMSRAENRRWQVVNSTSLISPGYRNWLERRQPTGWTAVGADRNLDLVELLQLLDRLARTKQIFYLHPAGGYFFDAFYLVPHRAVYELKRYSENIADELNPPPLGGENIADGEKFWDGAWRKSIQSVSDTLAHHPRDWMDSFLWCFNTDRPKDNQSRLLGQWYSMDLNHWGVELQKLQQLSAAEKRFQQAGDTTTNNFAVVFNLACNTNLQAGTRLNLRGVSHIMSQVRGRQQLDALVARYGPFDEPSFCYVYGDAHAQAGLFRQAMQDYDRAFALAPDAPASAIALAQLCAKWHLDEKLFSVVKQVHENPRALAALNEFNDAELARLEAGAWAARTNLARASDVLEDVRARHPASTNVSDLVLQSYLSYGDFANGLRCARALVAARPGNVDALVTESFVHLMLNRPADALTVLDRALTITNSAKARLNRAAAYTQLGKIAEAEADYADKSVQNYPAGAYQLNYGLAEIALKRGDTNSAIQHLELCILHSQYGTPEWQQAKSHLAYYKKSP